MITTGFLSYPTLSLLHILKLFCARILAKVENDCLASISRNSCMSNSVLLRLVPQMKAYDEIGVNWHPYIMFFQNKNYWSRVVSTDAAGFRHTLFGERLISPDSMSALDEISIVIGGSTAFGVGSSSNTYTVSSLLSSREGRPYLNLSGRAFNSLQELIIFKWFMSKAKKINRVILISGVNDLYLSHLTSKSFMPKSFFGDLYQISIEEYMLSPKRKLLKRLIGGMLPDDLNWGGVSSGEVFRLLTKAISKKFSTHHKHKLLNEYKPLQNRVANSLVQVDTSLLVWSALSKVMGFELLYVLQPFAGWIDKNLTEEEKEIFKYLDKSGGQSHKTLSLMSSRHTYRSFSDGISEICSRHNVDFIDSNTLLPLLPCDDKSWLFVDRVHLTDMGYQSLAKVISTQLGLP